MRKVVKKIKKKIIPLPAKNKNNFKKDFPIIGIGASAGGLESFIQFISNVPINSGMAFIFIQHLDPTHSSLSPEIISKKTKIKVVEAKNKMRIVPNCVFINPPNFSIEVQLGLVKLIPRIQSTSRHMSVDTFFRSLAVYKKQDAIGVVLSGTGTDGTEGLRAIHKAGGINCAQDPKTAKYQEMPQSVIAAKITQLVLPPSEMFLEISRLIKFPQEIAQDLPDGKRKSNSHLKEIFNILRIQSNVDFSLYKQATIERRIQRRISLLKLKDIEIYKQFLAGNQDEISALYNELLINVTEFFRDPESYKILRSKIFPAILKGRDEKTPIRIWVAGCASGEEVYSIAITLLESLERGGAKNSFQIFATDISESAIKKARAGVYPLGIEKSVSKERLKKYFEKIHNHYKVHKRVRDLCLFSIHNLTRDPPFARLDLISCRNVLIYFGALLQKQVIPIFHYALKPQGFLWLGKSESTNGSAKLFQAEDRTHKFYSKKNITTPLSFNFPPGISLPPVVKSSIKMIDEHRPKPVSLTTDFQKDADRIILSKFSPPGVIVNADLEVIQIRGQCKVFLEPTLSTSLYKMIRPELVSGLRYLVQQVKKENRPFKKERLHLQNHFQSKLVSLEILPINPSALPESRLYIVFFEEVAAEVKVNQKNKKNQHNFQEQEMADILQELALSKESQQLLVDQYESAQEELTAANEELQSTNEELQSTNEELETAKEELQSTNEELITVNDELQIRNSNLATLGNDLSSLLSSTEIPILMIGNDKCIRRFTPGAEKAFNIIPSDIGRPIGDIKSNFGLDMDHLIESVLTGVHPMEYEVQDPKGLWKRLQIRAYKTIDNKVDGVIVSLDDINDLKKKEKISLEAYGYVTSILDTVPFPIAVLDLDFKLKSVNSYFYRFFEITGNVIEQNIFSILEIQQSYFNTLHELFVQAIEFNKAISEFEINCDFPRIGKRKMLLSGAKIHWKTDNSPYVLLSFLDITERARVAEERDILLVQEQDARNEAESANNAKDVFLATLSHELRTPLSSILPWAQLIQMGKVSGEQIHYGATVIEQSVKVQMQLIDDLLDISRMIAGKLTMQISEVHLSEVISMSVESVRELAAKKEIQIEAILDPELGTILGDQVRLQQIFWNLLTNAIKFSPNKGRIEIRLKYVKQNSKQFAQISVIDSGKGIPEKFLPYVFDRFSQADGASTRIHGGLGLGLSIVQNLVTLLSGKITVENLGNGMGAMFTASFPVSKANDSIKATKKIDYTQYGGKSVKVDIREQPRLDGLSILYVDDQDSAREAISIYLKSFGAEVTSVETVREAMEKLTILKPDIIVSDIAMPEEDGYTLISKIRKLTNRLGKTPVIALSAYSSYEDVKRSLDSGFQAHVAKPIDADELGRVILKFTKIN